jgi:PAS domain-containing protein
MSNEEQTLSDEEMLRKKAEEHLKKKPEKIDKWSQEADMKKLVHELQVHQIELKMQNEELQEANKIAETALKKYTMLYDLAPMGYLTLDADGTICDLNFSAADILVDRRFSLLNSNFKLYVYEKSKPVFKDFFEKVFSSTAKESCEVMLGFDKNSLHHVYMEGIVTGEEQKCLLSVMDISNFKK